MITRALLIALLATTLLIGCSAQRLTEKNPVPTPAQADHDPTPKAQYTQPKYAPGYEDKEPKAKVPADACHPNQRIIAVFWHNSNVCFINGRELHMEGKAEITKYNSAVPFKYLAAALGATDYSFIQEKNVIILHYRGKDYRLGGRMGEDGVLYSSLPSILSNMGYDILRDHHWGRFEILDPLPLTADDLKIGELYLNMGIDKILSLLGPFKYESFNYSVVYYPEYTFESGFIHETPHTIMVRSDRFATTRGIRVGDNLSKVFELYGRGYIRGRGYAQPDVFEYHFPMDVRKASYLSFEVDESNRVKEIVLNGIALPHYQVTR